MNLTISDVLSIAKRPLKRMFQLAIAYVLLLILSSAVHVMEHESIECEARSVDAGSMSGQSSTGLGRPCRPVSVDNRERWAPLVDYGIPVPFSSFKVGDDSVLWITIPVDDVFEASSLSGTDANDFSVTNASLGITAFQVLDPGTIAGVEVPSVRLKFPGSVVSEQGITSLRLVISVNGTSVPVTLSLRRQLDTGVYWFFVGLIFEF